MDKTTKLAYELSLIMKKWDISNEKYMIIASYCLKDYREVLDLDVVITPEEYKILEKNIKDKTIGKAYISGENRMLLSNGIEIFCREKDSGFPTQEYSLEYLQKTKGLSLDIFGNPYFNLETGIKHYSDLTKKDNTYYFGPYIIGEERVIKNINHLKHITDPKYKDVIDEKIKYLESLLK